jgi:hypothetical protein
MDLRYGREAASNQANWFAQAMDKVAQDLRKK